MSVVDFVVVVTSTLAGLPLTNSAAPRADEAWLTSSEMSSGEAPRNSSMAGADSGEVEVVVGSAAVTEVVAGLGDGDEPDGDEVVVDV